MFTPIWFIARNKESQVIEAKDYSSIDSTNFCKYRFLIYCIENKFNIFIFLNRVIWFFDYPHFFFKIVEKEKRKQKYIQMLQRPEVKENYKEAKEMTPNLLKGTILTTFQTISICVSWNYRLMHYHKTSNNLIVLKGLQMMMFGQQLARKTK